jgi:hypothetical protein
MALTAQFAHQEPQRSPPSSGCVVGNTEVEFSLAGCHAGREQFNLILDVRGIDRASNSPKATAKGRSRSAPLPGLRTPDLSNGAEAMEYARVISSPSEVRTLRCLVSSESEVERISRAASVRNCALAI